jgi:hypothetical protein
MCLMSSPAAPTPAARLPQAAQTPGQPPMTPGSSRSSSNRSRGRRSSSTVLTSSRGVTDGVQSGAKTLLGQ